MQKFLSGIQISKKIREICKGDSVRIATAYWGNNIPEELFSVNYSHSRIICDITSGGTNPAALIGLGAPHNKSLRHVRGLHTKIYISSVGCVVGSANASRNGIGIPPATIEAGIFCTPGEAWGISAAEWFEEQWGDAKWIDQEALDRCTRNWRRAASRRAVEAIEGQNAVLPLPELLRSNPEVFGDIQFLLTNEPIDPEIRRAAFLINQQEEPDQNPARFCLFGWNLNENIEVPSRFISIHRGNRGGYWMSLLTPGFLRPNIEVYSAVPHRLKSTPFSDLSDVLMLGNYNDWPDGGGGYRLGRGAFDADNFGRAIDIFYTAEDLNKILK